MSPYKWQAHLDNYEKKINLFEKDWEKFRENKFDIEGKYSSKLSVLGNINSYNKLLTQNPRGYDHMVINNTSGTSIKCGVIEEKGVVAHYTTYYAYIETKE